MTRRRFFTAAAALAACALALAQFPPWGSEYPGSDEAPNVATGDISSVTIETGGWIADVVVAGFTTGATYAYGINTTTGDVSAAKVAFTVVSLGYDSAGNATTITRTVYGVKAVRKPYPDHATLDETGGGNLTFKIALSEPIFAKDNTGAGNSGTAPTVTIAAGLVTNTGGASETSASATALAVTNNSTLAYPKVIGRFAIEDKRPVNGTADVEVVAIQAFAGNQRPVACVVVSATGGTSSHVETGSAAAMTKSTRADALPVFAIPLNLSTGAGFTRGEAVTVKFTAYPRVGDSTAVLDSTTDAGSKLQDLHSLIWTIMSPMIAVVDPTNGNDTSGVASATQATADAAPCQTIAGAITKIAAANNSAYSLNRIDGGVVQCMAGTYSVNTRGGENSTNGYFTITHHATTNQAGVVFQQSSAKYFYARERLYDVTITRSSTGYLFFHQAGHYAVLENVNFADSQAGGWYSGDSSTYNSCVEFIACTSTSTYFHLGGNDFMGSLMRSDVTTPTTTASGHYIWGNHQCVIGCTVNGGAKGKYKANANAGSNNLVFAYNKVLAQTDGYLFEMGGLTMTNVAVVCNLVERLGASATPLSEISDANHSNVLHFNNTFAGQRFNHENDIASPYVNKTFTNWYMRQNAFNSRGDHRADIRDTDGSMVGTWWIGYSVGCSDNHNEGIGYAGDSDFFGIRSNTPYANAISPTVAAGFTDDNSRSGSDDGYGDYTPAVGSILRNRIPAGECVIPFDINGRAYNNYGLGDIGAIQHFIPTGGQPFQDFTGGFGE